MEEITANEDMEGIYLEIIRCYNQGRKFVVYATQGKIKLFTGKECDTINAKTSTKKHIITSSKK